MSGQLIPNLDSSSTLLGSIKKKMKAQFSTILVPQGSEYRAVCKGLKGLKRPTVIAVPMGSAIREFLKKLELAEGSILFLGVAGSLSAALNIGDIVCYKSCSLWQGEAIEGQLSCYSLFNEKIKQVQGITSDRLICTPEDKKKLSQYGDVVDLESYEVIKTYQHILISIVRVISDHSQQRIPDLSQAITPEGRLDPMTLGVRLLRDPWASGHLITGSLKALNRLESITREIFI